MTAALFSFSGGAALLASWPHAAKVARVAAVALFASVVAWKWWTLRPLPSVFD